MISISRIRAWIGKTGQKTETCPFWRAPGFFSGCVIYCCDLKTLVLKLAGFLGFQCTFTAVTLQTLGLRLNLHHSSLFCGFQILGMNSYQILILQHTDIPADFLDSDTVANLMHPMYSYTYISNCFCSSREL